MTTAQGWAVIGVLMTALAIIATLSIAMISSLRTAIDARFDSVDARFDAVDARFESVNTRFDGVDKRLDLLDRDVQNVIGRMFRDG